MKHDWNFDGIFGDGWRHPSRTKKLEILMLVLMVAVVIVVGLNNWLI